MKFLLSGVLLLTGCEFLYTREVSFRSIDINHQPVIQVDYSQMPEGSVVVESEKGEVAATGDSLVHYRLYHPAVITITPLESPRGYKELPRE